MASRSQRRTSISTTPPALQLPRRSARRGLVARASSSSEESGNVLEAFFVGRAFAEVVNERLGASVGDALAAVGRLDAELRQAAREIEEEVMSRARREMMVSAGAADLPEGPDTAPTGTAGLRVPPPDLPELVDNLRADVAAARSTLQALKKAPQSNGSGR
jgi:hypothetical protein